MKRKPTVGRIQRIVAIAALLGAGAVLAASEGRISGEVVDPAGNPIEGVQVTVRAREVQYVREAESNKKGRFTIVLLDATREFDIRLEKEGYQPIEEPLDPEIGGVLKRTWQMVPGEAPTPPEQLERIERRDRGAKLYNQGVQAFQGGDFEGATELFEQSLEADSELGPAHLALARIHLAGDGFAEALPHAEKAAELLGEDDTSHLLLVDALWGVEEYERALEVIDRMAAEGRAPDKIAVRVFNAGVREVKENDLSAARARFEQALELDPELYQAHLTLAQIAVAGSEFESALEHAELYLASEPESSRGLSVLYQAHLGLGRQEEAEAVFAKLVAVDPGRVAETLLEQGVTQFNAGQNAAAIASFERVLSADPDHVRGHYMLGLAYASGGELEKAKEHLNRFLQLAPDDPQAETAREMLAGLGSR